MSIEEKAMPSVCGYFILVEMEGASKEVVSEGGIIVETETTLKIRTQDSCFGWVRGIGPTAYMDYPGCDRYTKGGILLRWLKRIMTGCDMYTKDASIAAARQWGIEIGDYVEYRPHEGMACRVKGFENFRYIPDNRIMGKISES